MDKNKLEMTKKIYVERSIPKISILDLFKKLFKKK